MVIPAAGSVCGYGYSVDFSRHSVTRVEPNVGASAPFFGANPFFMPTSHLPNPSWITFDVLGEVTLTAI